MRRLSPVDAAFLLLEQRHQPLHVGALNLYVPPPDAPPDFAARLVNRLRAGAEALPPFNRRLVTRLGVKYWEEAEDFDMAQHLVHLALPKPGRIRELLAMVSRIHSAHLDRAYPLWRMYVIEGLEDGRIATYTKIHHALVDGVAGIRLMLKSMSNDASESLAMPPPWAMRARKSKAAVPVLAAAAGSLSALNVVAGSGPKSVPIVLKQLRQTWNDARHKHPDLVTSYQAPHCVLNQNITGSRRFSAQSYSTPRLKVIGAAFSASLNDVVLALCGAALRRYLKDDLKALPDKPLIALVPVSIRRDDGDSGNEVAMALANLATNVESPADRLKQVKASMDYNKARFRQMTPAQLMAYSVALLVPGAVLTFGGLSRKAAIANVIISHVPGPKQTQYWQGCKLDGVYPASIVIDKFALNITLISRHDFVDIGIIACRKTLPSMQRLLDYIEDAIVKLEAVVR